MRKTLRRDPRRPRHVGRPSSPAAWNTTSHWPGRVAWRTNDSTAPRPAASVSVRCAGPSSSICVPGSSDTSKVSEPPAGPATRTGTTMRSPTVASLGNSASRLSPVPGAAGEVLAPECADAETANGLRCGGTGSSAVSAGGADGPAYGANATVTPSTDFTRLGSITPR